MTSVLVGQSYFLRFDPKLWRAMRPYPPLGSLYAVGELRARGHDVSFFDAVLATSEDEWDAALARHRPRVAMLFEDSFNYLSKMCLLRMREAAFRMLGMAAARGCVTVVCGSDATDNRQRYLDAGADYVVVGEGERAVVELLDRLDHGDGDGADSVRVAIRGVAERDGGGGAIETTRAENLKDLDSLAGPAWDAVDMDRYRDAWRPHGRFSLNVATTRGCPFRCNWCAKPIWGQRYNSHSPEWVVDQVATLRTSYQADHIAFVDDIFGLKPGWIAAYRDLVRARDLVVPFSCLSRADLLLRDGEVDALRDAGCETVWMGAESGAQSVLDAMDKGTRVEQIEQSAARLRAAGIRVAFFLQFGYPGEGLAEIDLTRQLVRRCRPDDIGISVSYPLPGTAFHEAVQAQLGPQRNWVDSADLAMLYRGPFTTDFYRHLHRVVHREFRLRGVAGTTSVATHLARAAVRPARRDRLARARDAVLLPVDEHLLRRRARHETST